MPWRWWLGAAIGCLVLGAGTGRVAAQPALPAIIYGTAAVDGRAVPDGTAVRGLIGGQDCTQADSKGTVTEGGVSRYAIVVMHESQKAGCGREGLTVTFTVGGRATEQTVRWKAGEQQLDLRTGDVQATATQGVASAPTVAGAGTVEGGGTTPPADGPTEISSTAVAQPPGTAGKPKDAEGEGRGLNVVALGGVIVMLGALGALAWGRVRSGRGGG